MAAACPIAFRSIDGTIARLNALTVSLLLIAFTLTNEVVILFILAIDFLIRLYGNKSYSISFQISSLIKELFSMQTTMVDAGAKRLASQFGVLFTLSIMMASFFQLELLAFAITFIFLACTAFEFFFSYCIACKVYFLVQKFH